MAGRRGFAALSPEERSRIARLGGKTAHRKGTAHHWNKDTAKVAGKKGGHVSQGGRGRHWVKPGTTKKADA